MPTQPMPVETIASFMPSENHLMTPSLFNCSASITRAPNQISVSQALFSDSTSSQLIVPVMIRMNRPTRATTVGSSVSDGPNSIAGTFATTRLAVPPNPFALAATQMLVGGVILLTVSLAMGDRLDVASVAPVSWWALGYMAVVVSLGAFSAYAYALSTLPVSTVATYAYVNPVIAVALGWAVYDESLSAIALAGAAIIVASVAAIVRLESAAEIEEEPPAPALVAQQARDPAA